ncbi:hypothetical protein MLD38_003605 [Melastoma candidum]|uniref:Uncharacterized protein n=1 Tax=Melastoma candidum TaxID=119954 RepID=A0ACB9S4N7_9MYRT|nr:hypothetical protein MLD38_003605 [Melastoma candidum]
MVKSSIRCSWTVNGGSLSDYVTLEDSSVTDPDPDPDPRTPLLLLRPDSSPPCEITLDFGQRRDVQQVYLRSTARVYEVYYSTDQHPSSPEYLCTVRCGLLAESDHVNLTPPCEDDWVDVNFPRPMTPRPEFYEATAQISDADPCTSITIRLLSIQTGDCVSVDQLYIFAEPVDIVPDVKDDRTESTSGNPLMAMLVPTLLQLSRSGLANQVQGALAGDRKDGPGFPNAAGDGARPDLRPKLSSLAYPLQPKVSDVRSSTALESPCERFADQKPDTPCHCLDTVLKDLLSRVRGIEQSCLRFEEHMLRPLSSIEARLARVEAQLEALNRKSTGGWGCNNFSIPGCLPGELSPNAFSNSNCEELRLDDGYLSKPPIQLDNTSDSVAAGINRDSVFPLGPSDRESDHEGDSTQNEAESPEEKLNRASLVLGSSDVGDNYETDAPKQDDESSKTNAKRALSVDEALAFALAGFVSSIDFQPVKDTSCVVVKDSEFSPKDNEPCEDKSQVPSECNDISDSSTHLTDRSKCTKDSHTSTLLPHVEVCVGDCPCDEYVEKAGEEQDELSGPTILATFDDYWRIGVAEHGEAIAEKSSVFACDDDAPLQKSHQTQSIGSLCLGEEATILGSKVLSGKNENIMGPMRDVLDDVLSFSHDACVVDFESPILDVKFISEERSYAEYALESLLSNMDEANVGPSPEGKSTDLSLDVKPENLIVVDNGETLTCSTNCIDHCYCDLLDISDKEDVKASFQVISGDDIFAGSLI